MLLYSLRSREEERTTKPGAISTPVKHADDHTSKTVEEVIVERNEKQAPTLPGMPRKSKVQENICSLVKLSVFIENIKMQLLLLLLNTYYPHVNFSVLDCQHFLWGRRLA